MRFEQEQEELLSNLVEAYRNQERDKRAPFLQVFFSGEINATIKHAGFPSGHIKAYPGDLDTLARAGLIFFHPSGSSVREFDISPEGFDFYAEIKDQESEPLRTVELTYIAYLESSHFRATYGKAYQKWRDAESLLWRSDSENQLTTIGHLCREAIQEFADSLVTRNNIQNVDPNKAHDIARIKAVIHLYQTRLGLAERAFLDAVLTYWGTISDLIQRQEHGGQKEGRALVWEDGRRVVFQTAIVMHEVDNGLGRTR